MSKDYDLLKNAKEIVINQDGGGICASVYAKLLELDDEQGDITVSIIGLYNLNFHGTDLSCSISDTTIIGITELKLTYHEIRKIYKVGRLVFVDLEKFK